MSTRLDSHEARSLLEVLGLALGRRDAAALMEAASERWRGRLARAAGRSAEAMRAGGSPVEALEGVLDDAALAALRAGEAGGDLAAGVDRAARAAGRGARVSRLVTLPVVYPVLVLSLCGLSAALLAALAAGPLQELRVELAWLDGRPAPGGLLAFAAAHPQAAVALGLLLALAPVLAPIAIGMAARTRRGSRWLLALPVFGAAARWRACADFAGALGDLIAAGLPHDEAWRRASAAVGSRALSAALLERVGSAAAGEPPAALLIESGLPAEAARRLQPARLAADGGVAALRELGEEADRRQEGLLQLGGRLLAGATGLAGVAVALGLIAAVLLPLLGAGGAG